MTTYATTYQIVVQHPELHKYRLIRGTDKDMVEQQAAAQLLVWDEIWEKKRMAESIRDAKQKAAQQKEAKKNLAAERTAEAQDIISGIEKTLQSALNANDRIDWDSLLDRKPFPKPLPIEPKYLPHSKEPKDSDSQFIPTRKWYYMIFRNLCRKAEQEAKNKFSLAHDSWRQQMIEVDVANSSLRDKWNLNVKRWQQEKEEYERSQAKTNDIILNKKKAYYERNPQVIIEYFDMVLANSQYPDTFPQEWNLEYIEDTKTIAVDYFLPSPDQVPALKEVKYIASRDEFQEVRLQEAAFNKMYDSLLYQIALRSIHEIYKSDQVSAAAAVVFNGWVRSIDRGTGKPITICVLSVQALRDEFLRIDLRHVDPKICFKNLKGVGSSKLHGLSPIAPIFQLNKEDKRFISSYSMVGEVDQSTNLAAMDWEDFEHLIREMFAKEFSQGGGEVKITQASRDGGVDAVAFDPDPIRGGKIVIQAKRYTKTVGVSAVRDLYGTVVNEGAMKGILVTTADYGPDAYGFAKGKPLTLLSGSNLLHLLEKHGHKATIDLKAAKQILADQKKAEEERH